MSLSQRRKNRVSQKARCVAIWIGDLETEASLDDYLRLEFQYDFEAEPDERNPPEIVASADPEPIRKLLDGFSESRLFLNTAVKEAEIKGIFDSRSAVVYYYTHFDERGFSLKKALPLQFLANITW